MKKVNFGIIGISNIATKALIPAIQKSSKCNIVGIGSRDYNKAKFFAKKLDCKTYGNYETILDAKGVDAVYISLPPKLHEEWCIKAAKQGKHILCEKSLSTNHNSTKKILSICKKNNLHILENFAFKFHPQHTKVLHLIKNKKIGEVKAFHGKFGFNRKYSKNDFRFNKKLGGGALNDVGCYLISASLSIFGKKPNYITCNLKKGKHTNAETQGSFHLMFEDKIATGVFGYNMFFESSYQLWGDKGNLYLNKAYNAKNHLQKILINTSKGKKVIPINSVNQFELMLKEFSNSLQSTQSSIFEKDILLQSLVMDAARKSAYKQKTVQIK